MPTEPAVKTAHRLMDSIATGALSTIGRVDGAPFASLVLIGLDDDRRPVLLLSRLAEHMKNIAADPRVALLIDGTAGLDDPMSGERLTLCGRLVPEARTAARNGFLERHAPAAAYAGFDDFLFLRLDVSSAHLVAGYGRITTLDPAELNGGPALPLTA